MRLKTALTKAMAIVAVVCVFTQGHAAEAPYPTKPVTIVVPFPPGGSADGLTRAVAKGLTEMWGRSTVVENRPGAASMIVSCIGQRRRMVPVLTATSSYPGQSPCASNCPSIQLGRSFRIIRGSQQLTVHPSVPAKTVKEFIAIAKHRPLNYSTSGAGGNHFAMEFSAIWQTSK
jgi:tripartite-type tricarboxylate transporter receptor subunit TctC